MIICIIGFTIEIGAVYWHYYGKYQFTDEINCQKIDGCEQWQCEKKQGIQKENWFKWWDRLYRMCDMDIQLNNCSRYLNKRDKYYCKNAGKLNWTGIGYYVETNFEEGF